MDRVFLDANVLFSASYSDDNRLLKLWSLADVELVTSSLAVAEALRNLETDLQRERLNALLANIAVVSEASRHCILPAGVSLPEKDAPILLAAIQAQVKYLLTGDKRHFGPLYGLCIDGVLIQRPSIFLAGRGV